MKNLKRIMAVVLAILIFALSLPTATVFADTPDRYGRILLGQMQNGAKLQSIYDSLVTACSGNTPTQISIDQDWQMKIEHLDIAYKMFYRDYPEYFWIQNGGWSFSYIPDQDDIPQNIESLKNNTVTGISPKYIAAFTNLSQAKSLYNQKVSELTNGLNGKTEYEKSIILHDRIAETVTYEFTDKDQTSYGALIEGKCVCNGYARAYQHLLQEVGVTAWYVSGSSYKPNTLTLEAHAWNLVKINGNWYYTDVTWDDSGDAGFYAYFNMTTSQLNEDHIIGEFEEYLPNATATADNYFVKQNLVFNSYDQNRLISLLNNSDFKAQIYINGDIENFKTQITNNRSTIATALGAIGSYVCSLNSIGNALIIDFDMTVACVHSYTNACDTSCNKCGDTRSVNNHTYEKCYEGYTKNLYGSWGISVNTTGVYTFKPNTNYKDTFSIHNIAVFDKNGNLVKFNESKGGFPLVADKDYVIKFKHDCSDKINGAITWTKTIKSQTIFSDVSSGDWYNGAVNYAVGRGIISGYGGTTKFGPGDNIQRQDFMVILAKLDGVDLTQYGNKKSAFSDVPEGSYFEAAVNWGAEKGIVNGYANGKFGTGDKITREQLVKFLYNYANYKGIDTSYKNSTKTETKKNFTDYNQISSWALDSVLWAKEKGIISGKTATTLVPAGNALRCEVAQIMYNLFLNETFE